MYERGTRIRGIGGSTSTPIFTDFLRFAFVLLAATVADHATPQVGVSDSYGRLKLHFEANRGQAREDVRFLSRGPGYSLYLTAGEAALVLAPPSPDGKLGSRGAQTPKQPAVLRTAIVGAQSEPLTRGLDELPGKANYFVGNDPSKWRTNVPTYAKVMYRDVYPGIDLVYYGNQRQLEYDFVVAPGADPRKITLAFQGAQRMEIDAKGDLLLYMAEGVLRQRKPLVYQEIDGIRKEVDGFYVRKGTHQVGFQVAAYDRSRPLVIDPVLSYSTYLGGGSTDMARAIAVDSAGNAYVAGHTASTNFPTKSGTFDTTYGGGPNDAFVAKLNPAGTAVLFSTYLGGGREDGATAVAVDIAGNLYITGLTTSADFPVTPGAFQTTHAGGVGTACCGVGHDVFVTKLDASGSALIYSTFLGGNGVDQAFGIAIDSAGNAYVTGHTVGVFPNTFPTTPGAFQTSASSSFGCSGWEDAFVTKLNPTGTALIYSTFLAGNSNDVGQGIAVDAAGYAYVTGVTISNNFPVTAGAHKTVTNNGLFCSSPEDAFVTKLNPSGTGLAYSTYLGGSSAESGTAIAIDAAGNAYVAGYTNSSNFPTTPGAFQSLFGGSWDAFVTKVNPAGSGLVYSTLLGGNGSEFTGGIAVDAAGNAHVTGGTDSTNFPTLNAIQSTFAGTRDAFVTKLNPGGTALVYSTYLGGAGDEHAFGMALDASGSAYLAGASASGNFPITSQAFQNVNGGSYDAFVAKIAEVTADLAAPITTANVNPAPNPAGWNAGAVTVTLSATDAGGSGVQSITYAVNGGAPTTVNGASASFTVSAEGTHTISYFARDVAGNVEAAGTRVVRIDTIAPSTTASASPPPNADGWNISAVTVTLSATDNSGGSGVQSIHYTISNGLSISGGSVAGANTSFTVSAEGVNTITYYAVDNAGNAEAVSTLEVRIRGALTGVSWMQLTPVGASPVPRCFGSSTVYDPLSNRLLLYSGALCSVGHASDVWALTNANGTGGTPQWINLGSGGPGGTHNHTAVYDERNDRMIVYGGCLGGCFPIQPNVWILENASGTRGSPRWFQLGASGTPQGRQGHQAFYDPNTNRMIVWGGQDGGGSGFAQFREVWVLTNANGLGSTPIWTRLATAGGPPEAAYFSVGVYDSASNRLVVFGGSDGGRDSNAVWVLSNANGLGGTPTWINTVRRDAAGSPPPRSGAQAVYNPADNTMTIFDGGPTLKDVWRLSNANGLGGASVWTQLAVTGGPQGGAHQNGRAYDPATNTMMSFVNNAANTANEVWLLRGSLAPVDTAAPTTTASANPPANGAGWNNANVTVTLTATDNAGGSGVQSITYTLTGAIVGGGSVAASSTSIPISAEGVTTVTYAARDNAGNVEPSQTVTVKLDKTAPTVTAPANQLVEATSAAGAVVTFSASATDNLDPSPTVTASPASGSTFALGTTTVTVTATDAAGNSSTNTFTVTVQDTTPPVIGAVSNLTAEATSAAGAVVSFALPTATDAVGATPTVTASPASGSTFALGTTTVTVTATDAAGNSSTKTFTVTVQDTTPPALTVPAAITREATAPLTPVSLGTATALDLVDGPVAVSNNAPTAGYPIGTTVVTWTAVDSRGNQATATQSVTITDTTAPILTMPANITTSATSPAGAAVSYTVTATDNSGLAPSVACTPASGSTFPIGTSTVNCSATDAAGNTASGGFSVTVLSPAQQASNLIAAVNSFGLNGGTANSLTSKIDNAVSSLATGNAAAACNQLNALINQANAQSGKQLTAAQASELITAANQIRAAQGCQ